MQINAGEIFLFKFKFFTYSRLQRYFKGRWGTECEYCGSVESDVHLFSCAGYTDLLSGARYDMFMNLDVSMDELSAGAKKLLKVKNRLELLNTSDSR